MATLERPKCGYLTPDELIRFVKEAEAAWEWHEDFRWRDEVGREWLIVAMKQDAVEGVGIGANREGKHRGEFIASADFNDERARQAIERLDKDEVWA